MKAKKSFGQHFLNREDIAMRIADSLQLAGTAYQQVLEIGPGKGMLTKYLLKKTSELTVVEADRDMVEYLHKHYPVLGDRILAEDFLKLPLEDVFGEATFGLIGNFPYNISSQILFRMLDYKDQIPEMAGMFQKEVAERIVAPPGSKTYGIISVLMQAFYEGQYLFTVDKSCFTPPPQVQSGVIRLTRKANAGLPCNEKLFKQVVKQAFSQRRKMLRNTMKLFLAEDALLADPFFTQRPEQLSLEDFIQVTQWIEARRKSI